MSKPRAKMKSSAAKHEVKPAAKPKKPHATASAKTVEPTPRTSPPVERRRDDGDAFVPDPGEGPARVGDDLAEVLAEDFLESATRGNEVFEDESEDEAEGVFAVKDVAAAADDVDEEDEDEDEDEDDELEEEDESA